MQIPKKSEDINKEYLTNALKFGEIKEITKSASQTQGYSSESQIFTLTYTDENNKNPTKIFVKHGVPEKTTVYPYLYKSEIKWLKLNSEMAPKYYFSQFEEGYFVLVMEFLNGKIGVQKDGTPLEDAFFIIKEWAKFQKKYLHSRSDEKFKQDHKLDFANIVDLCIHLFSDPNPYPKIDKELIDKHTDDFIESWKQSYETFKTLQPHESNDLKEFRKLLEQFDAMDLKKFYSQALLDALDSIQSVVHNDFRADHFCFVDGKLKLLDWQAVCVGSPLVDVAKLLTENIHTSDLKNSWKDLLQVYHENIFNETDIKFEGTVKMLRTAITLNIGRILYLTKLFGAVIKGKDTTDVTTKIFVDYVTNVLWAIFNIE